MRPIRTRPPVARPGTVTGGLEPLPGSPRAATDLVLLAVAIVGISFSGPLIAATAAPALAIAFWRNALATAALSPLALLRNRRELLGLPRRTVVLAIAAGGLLAVHFALWVPSLAMTSVASSTALVTTTPIWTVLLLRLGGHRVPGRLWAGIAAAFLGVLILTGVDLSLSLRALAGDALALAGGMAAAAYVLLGAQVRRTASTISYTFLCYGTAGASLLVACLATGQSVAGYPAVTWLKLAVLTVTAQLLGHSLVNRVVRGLGPSVTSTAILLETPGATLVAALWLGQQPPAAAYPALIVILAGLALVIRGTERRSGAGEPQAPGPAAGAAGSRESC